MRRHQRPGADGHRVAPAGDRARPCAAVERRAAISAARCPVIDRAHPRAVTRPLSPFLDHGHAITATLSPTRPPLHYRPATQTDLHHSTAARFTLSVQLTAIDATHLCIEMIMEWWSRAPDYRNVSGCSGVPSSRLGLRRARARPRRYRTRF